VVVWTQGDEHQTGIAGRIFQSNGTATGPEFQVNTNTPFSQEDPSVAADSNGRFVVVWNSTICDGVLWDGKPAENPLCIPQDGWDYGVFARQFDSEGQPLGSEIQVNAFTDGHNYEQRVACFGDGGFVVVWHGPGDQKDIDDGIRAQVFDSMGIPVGSEIIVDSDPYYSQYSPKIVTLSEEMFVVTWERCQFGGSSGSFLFTSCEDVVFRIYSSTGTPMSGVISAPTGYLGYQRRHPEIAQLTENSFILVWEIADIDFWVDGIALVGRVFSTNGTSISSESTIVSDDIDSHTVIAFTENDIVVLYSRSLWVSPGAYWDNDTFGTQLDAASMTATNPTVLNSKYTLRAATPLDSNSFLVTWSSSTQVLLQRYKKDGSKIYH